MASNFLSSRAALALIPVALTLFYGQVLQRPLAVLGVFRTPVPTVQANADDFIFIDDTVHCEDVHYYEPTNVLFAACEDSPENRFLWFPPLGMFQAPEIAVKTQGSIHVIDVATKKSTRLGFENFKGPLVTHGIDVIADSKAVDPSVYIFAVNHVPDASYLKSFKADTAIKSASRVEIFHHVLGSLSARHIRTVQHPLITTPNDIIARSPSDFFVTNDHLYRDGSSRLLEDLYWGATWSDTIHVRIEDEGINATVATTGLHNNNGLGRGRTEDEVLVGSAFSGTLHLGKYEGDKIAIKETIKMDSAIDNPSFFRDPFADDKLDASGYVLAGLANAFQLAKTAHDPTAIDGVLLWLVKPSEKGWEKKLLFQDDGKRLRTASAAVLVGIDPAEEGGRRRAWAFVTGFMSKSMIAVKVDL
ncbi:hypothetical protein G7046_g7181 [Stylonectria norvegica]|nr:hypothetical protein G7046_g7181 [Stylonectria norvegica]